MATVDIEVSLTEQLQRMRTALQLEGVVYTVSGAFDLETAQLFFQMNCVPSDDLKALKKTVKASFVGKDGAQTVKAEYDFSRRTKACSIGRLYEKGVGLAMLTKGIRNAIAARYYDDWDIKNSHPTILLCICTKKGWVCTSLRKYVKDRTPVLESIKRDYGLETKAAAKFHVLRVVNGGNPPPCCDDSEGQFLHELKAEMKAISNNLYTDPEFASYAKVAKKKKGAVTCLADVLADIEFDLLMTAVQWLRGHNHDVGALMMDGCYVRKLPVTDNTTPEQYEAELNKLMRKVERVVCDQTSFQIELCHKAMDSEYAEALENARAAVLPTELQGLGLLRLCNGQVQPDKPMANLMCAAIGQMLRGVLRYVGPGEYMYAYDSVQGIWSPVDSDYAVSLFQDSYLNWYLSDESEVIPDVYLNESTHLNVLSKRGGQNLFSLMKPYLLDSDFLDRLDTTIPQGLIPFKNTCVRVDKDGVHLVPHSPNHFISKTIAYELPPEEAMDFSEVDAFYKNYWADEDKRTCMLMSMAAALIPQYRASQKQILVGIDDADGNCGKSMCAKVVADVFDVLAMPLQKTMVYDTASMGGRNSHGANELSYKTALWVYLDEMQNEQKFNVESLKQLAGGGITFACRAFHSAKMIKFPWVALVALFCNKGCLPEFDSSNKVLLARLRFALFEVVFTAPTGAAPPAGHDKALIKQAVDNVQASMKAHRAAHMWRLLKAAHILAREYGGAVPESKWPQSWTDTRNRSAAAADTLQQVVEEVIIENVVPGRIQRPKRKTSVDVEVELVVDQESGNVRVNLLTHKPHVDYIKRSLLKDDVEKQLGADRKRYQSKDIKSRLDATMASLGYAFVKDSELFGVTLKVCYLGCKHRSADFATFTHGF